MKHLLLVGLPLLIVSALFSSTEALRYPKEERSISEEEKANLFKEWKIDPEERRARLERIRSKVAESREETNVNQAKERSTNSLLEFEHTKDYNDFDVNEINERSGIAPYLYDGDIHLTEEQLNEIERMTESTRAKRQLTTLNKRWPNNTVYYFYHGTFYEDRRGLVDEAHRYIESHTCINFVENSTAPNKVVVYYGPGCFSQVGMNGGLQILSLGAGCSYMELVAHEFIHAIGSYHMHSRSDRDEYLTIDYSVIQPGANGSFRLNTDDLIYTPYDYSSIMHYAANQWVVNSTDVSMIPKDMRFLYGMGSKQFSFYDFQMINDHYDCNALCTPQNSANCQNGGVPNPRNCAECNCPRGYGGALCDQRPPGCGASLRATAQWQSEEFRMGNYTEWVSPNLTLIYCNHWITAPPGKQIEVQVIYMHTLECQLGCMFNGFELKVDSDPRESNPLYCCNESFTGKVFKSALNPMPVISYTRTPYIGFGFEYRYVDGPAPPITPKPVPNTNCRDTTPTDFCEILKASGHCDTKSDFSTMKYYCGKTCGFCGKAADPCVDNNNCAQILKKGGCASMDPMEAEYKCAKSCGYCEHPN